MKLNPLWDIAFGVTLATVAFWYYRANRVQRSVSKVRQILFYFGMGVLALMLVGPVPHKAVAIFWVHMIQHISIMMLISPTVSYTHLTLPTKRIV